jgi:surface antigen
MYAVSDVELMQFADGTLDPEVRARVEAELARSQALRERLDAFVVTGRSLARLFDPLVEAPVPDRLLKTLMQPDGSTPQRQYRSGGALWQRLRDLIADSSVSAPWRLAPAACAAAVLGVVAVGAGAIWGLRPSLPDSLVGPTSEAMALALERTPSAGRSRFSLAARGNASLEPTFSFQHRDGRFCRQYEMALTGGKGFIGFACRSPDGSWIVERDVVASVRHDDGPDGIRTAGKPSVQAIEDAVEGVMVGDPIEKDREQALIQGGWQTRR